MALTNENNIGVHKSELSPICLSTELQQHSFYSISVPKDTMTMEMINTVSAFHSPALNYAPDRDDLGELSVNHNHDPQVGSPNAGIDLHMPTENGVTLQENLPSLLTENWADASDHLDEQFYSALPPPPAQGKMAMEEDIPEENKWSLIIDKLTNIENNTSTLSRDLTSLSEKVDSHSTQLLTVNSTISSNEKRLSELHRKHNSIASEIDQKVEARFRSLKAALKKENEILRGELLKQARIQAEKTTQDLRDEVLQDQCDARKHNLIIIGLRPPKQDSGSEVDLAQSFFANRMGLTGVEVDVAYRLGRPGGAGPRPLLVKFTRMAHRNKVWFAKSTIAQDKNSKVWIQEDLPKPVKNIHRTLYRILRAAKSMGDRFHDVQIKGKSII